MYSRFKFFQHYSNPFLLQFQYKNTNKDLNPFLLSFNIIISHNFINNSSKPKTHIQTKKIDKATLDMTIQFKLNTKFSPKQPNPKPAILAIVHPPSSILQPTQSSPPTSTQSPLPSPILNPFHLYYLIFSFVVFMNRFILNSRKPLPFVILRVFRFYFFTLYIPLSAEPHEYRNHFIISGVANC